MAVVKLNIPDVPKAPKKKNKESLEFLAPTKNALLFPLQEFKSSSVVKAE